MMPDLEPFPPERDAEVMTLHTFVACARDGLYTQDDGAGYYATKDAMSRLSVWAHGQPSWATHVVWYTK